MRTPPGVPPNRTPDGSRCWHAWIVAATCPDSTPDDLRAMAADIRAAVDQAEHLIGALLILARNERGLTVHEEVDLATVAEDVLESASLGDRRAHATLEPAVISGDPVLAERLVANLVDNAARFNTAAGDTRITTRAAAGSSQLTVADTGPVISPADAHRIFQPFERPSDRASHDGFGLGLTIVAFIAAFHGGSVVARPRNDGGLSVTVRSLRRAPRPLAEPERPRSISASVPKRGGRVGLRLPQPFSTGFSG
jgi:signal transduction histidine kinase